MLGLATLDPAAVQVLEDLLSAGAGLDLIEREVAADAVGGPPGVGPRLVVAVVRGARCCASTTRAPDHAAGAGS